MSAWFFPFMRSLIVSSDKCICNLKKKSFAIYQLHVKDKSQIISQVWWKNVHTNSIHQKGAVATKASAVGCELCQLTVCQKKSATECVSWSVPFCFIMNLLTCRCITAMVHKNVQMCRYSGSFWADVSTFVLICFSSWQQTVHRIYSSQRNITHSISDSF